MQHSGAFSFVDRITEFEPGTRARGSFAVPPHLPHLSPCLVAEAVGQLAAWVAMARTEFRLRPVAALAGAARIVGEAVPGRVLDLGVEIESCDEDAVAYSGWARAGDLPVVELRRCVGAMLPLRDFDAPEAARQHFATLCRPGVQPDGHPAIVQPDMVVIDCAPGKRRRAALQVPTSAAFFADHFPRKPVFPATLLIDAQIQLAVEIAREVLQPGVGEPLRPRCVRDVKLRSFILPGQLVELAIELESAAAEVATFALAATVEGKRVSRARVEVVASGSSTRTAHPG